MSHFAHSGQDKTPARSDWQPLALHLVRVAELAGKFAEPLKIVGRTLDSAAYAAGLLHDLGKYRPGFQGMIQGQPVVKESTYHKQAGAAYALGLSEKHRAVACAIAGHHGGLPSKHGLDEAVESGRPAVEAIRETAFSDCPELSGLAIPPDAARTLIQCDLETRLVFSCLVDADWSHTAEHDRKVRGWDDDPEPIRLDDNLVDTWLKMVLESIRARAVSCRSLEVARARDDVLTACRTAARRETPGLFTLTVPTGGGKTLSALAFALEHAAEYGLRRIIYVAPFLSILDQNARTIRDALGVTREGVEVFEHHSLGDLGDLSGSDDAQGDDQDEARRAAAARRSENWDAPVIITTNVQFFESLFSNRPGRCRKLHNIARSVIILDECQAIPSGFVAPTCAMLDDLITHLDCTIVLATATQPAFDHPALKAKNSALTGARPIVGPELGLSSRLRRVRIEWYEADETLGWDDVARRMVEGNGSEPPVRPAALCVVNTIRAAGELFEELSKVRRDGVFYLSTRLCPVHRLEVLDDVRARLDPKDGRPCYLVSTQLIEAGVDVDFPLVFREICPLDAIIQVSGRCNREGTLNGPDGKPGGLVVVFQSRASVDEPQRYYPQDVWYKQGRDTLVNSFLHANRTPCIDNPADVNEYYGRLFHKGDLDDKGIQALRKGLDFPAVAAKYRLIDDATRPVVVRWEKYADEIQSRLDAVRDRPTRRNYRRLAPFQVNLRGSAADLAPHTDEVAPGVHVWEGGYDEATGLTTDLPELSFGI